MSGILSVLYAAALADAPPSVVVTEAWQTDTWDLASGLPQSSVTVIEPTDDGRLWLGTFTGLVRFDGQSFESLNDGPDAPLRVTSLARAGDRLYVGTEREGVWRHDGQSFERLELPPGLAETTVWRLTTSSAGELWVAGASGAWRRDRSGRWDRVVHSQVRDVDIADDGTAWICGDKVWRWSAGGGRVLAHDSVGICTGGVVGPDGRYAAIADNGLAVVDDKGSYHVPVRDFTAHYLGEPLVDQHGGVWLGSNAELLYMGAWADLGRGTDELKPAARHELSGTVRDLWGMPSGAVWVGTDGGGLQRLSSMGFSRIRRTDLRGGTGAGPLTGSDDTAWFSVDCSHLLRSVHGQVPEPVALPHREGCLTAAATGDGGQVYAAQREQVFAVDRDVGTRIFAATDTVTLLSATRDELWIGTDSGHLWRVQDGQSSPVPLPDAMRGRELLALDVQGDDLVLGLDRGVAARTSGAWRVLGLDDGVPHGAVRDLHRAANGVIWLATYGGGLGWLDGDQAGMLSSGEQRWPDRFLSSIGAIDDEDLWLQGNAGLWRAPLAELEEARLDSGAAIHAELLHVGEANGVARPSAARLGDELWLAGVDGVAVVHLSELEPAQVVPEVVLVDARVGDVVVPADRASELASDVWRRLEVSYTAPTLEPQVAVTYQHRLTRAGLPVEPWVEAGASQLATYPDLAPGDYLFEVRSRGPHGDTSEATRLRFRLAPAWFERRGLRAALAATAFALALLVGLLRARSAERRATELEAEIRRRREAERELAHRESRYRQVFTQAANAFLLVGPDGRCQEVNEEACRQFRATPEQIAERSLAELGLPVDQDLRPTPQASPVVCYRIDGEAFPARVDVVPCQLGDGEGRLWSVVDLTRLVQAHDQEDRLRHQLQTAQRLEALGRLSGGMAHNLNNLLGIIASNVAHVHEVVDEPELSEALQDARDGVRRAAELLRQLLAFSRRGVVVTGSCDAQAVAARLERMLTPLLHGGVRLEVVLGEATGVGMAASQLEQVLLNLLLNATDASPPDGLVRLAIRRQGAYVELTVEDEGQGIDPAELDLVFDPFFTTKPQGEGTGLGLSSVKGIVEEAGGSVRLEPASARGTRAVVRLPAHALPDATQNPTTEAVPLDVGELVLVDDNAPLLRSLGRQLTRRGVRFTTFDDPVEARDRLLAGTKPPGVLVSDVMMPGLNGVQLTAVLRARWPELPVLLMSGYPRDVLGGDAPLQDVQLLAKPFSPEQFEAAVDAAVRMFEPKPATLGP